VCILQKKKKKAVAIDLDEVHVPSKSDSPNNVAAAAGAPKVDKMGNTIVADQVEEAYVPCSFTPLVMSLQAEQ
jgi:hypothetical protein